MNICTSEDMVAGGVELEMTCMRCCVKGKLKAGYIGVVCPNCGYCWTGEEWNGQIARDRREYLGLSRRQVAKILGKSIHTIRAYDWKKCPSEYLWWLQTKLEEKALQ